MLLHHAASAAGCLAIVAARPRFQGFWLAAQAAEVNSMFLHLRSIFNVLAGPARPMPARAGASSHGAGPLLAGPALGPGALLLRRLIALGLVLSFGWARLWVHGRALLHSAAVAGLLPASAMPATPSMARQPGPGPGAEERRRRRRAFGAFGTCCGGAIFALNLGLLRQVLNAERSAFERRYLSHTAF